MQADALSVEHLRVQSLMNPQGVDEKSPLFSWQLKSGERGVVQTAYRLTLTSDAQGETTVWDSGPVTSSSSTCVTAKGLQLQASTRYFWHVTVWDNKGNEATSSEIAYFDTGLMSTARNPLSPAIWIQVPANITAEGAPMFRKSFNLLKPFREAKLYTSGLGIYDVFINGQRVGHLQPDGNIIYEELKPGWTDYRYRVFYSSHDVTTLIAEGGNAIGATVTSGWWSGAISRGVYGNAPLGFIAKLLITYEDGTQETLVSDLTWRSSQNGAIRSGEIYDGEVYDARLESAWTTAAFDDSQWNGVEENTSFTGKITAYTGGYVQQLADKVQPLRKATVYKKSQPSGSNYGTINVVRTLSSAPIILTKGQAVILDFGQNIVGWVSFKVRGRSGNCLHIRFAEMLNDTGEKSRGNDGPGGSLYLANLRTAKAECFYTLSGKTGGEEYHSTTTFYGFRYCEIEPTEYVEILSCTALPISSSTEETGTLTTSNARVNQLISNIQWGQRGNLLSVPTDCPQRDERLGWSGDTQVFCLTAMYNADTESFFRKWLQDMRDSQRNDGAYSTVAPYTNSRIGAAAWSDAGILVPWRVYQMYGDKGVLSENFSAMEKYMEWLATQTDGTYHYAGGTTVYGDWLSYADTDARLIAVAYYAYDALIMSKIARALSPLPIGTYARKAAAYEELYKNIRNEFRSRYLPANLSYASQTALLLALKFGLYEGEDEKAEYKQRLAQSISGNNYMLNTGFVGTGILNQTLSHFGLTDYAYDLLLQSGCPSWLYSVDQGATTIWERWNSYTRESGFGPASMNSFNHYAYGAVGEWSYRYMAGIEPDEGEPGFHHFFLKPQPDRRSYLPAGQSLITSASATYQSRYGIISSAWSAPAEKHFVYDCTVPANTTATLFFPAENGEATVYENGEPAATAQGVTCVGYDDGCFVFELESGTYQFSTDRADGIGAIQGQETRDKGQETRDKRQGSGDEGQETRAVYDLGGRLVSEEADSSLKKGIYITTRKKILY